MDLRNFLVLSAFGINFVLALLVYIRSKKTKAIIAFEFTAFGISAWCMSMVFYRAAGDISTAIIWAKLLYFFPAFTPTAFLLFGLYFPKNKVNIKLVLLIILTTIIMTSITLLNEAVIKSIVIIPGQEKKIIFGWAYTLYCIYIPIFFAASYYVLLKKYLTANRFIRMQLLYILIGMTAASIPAQITNLTLPTFGYFGLNWAGQLFTIFWISGVSYAIIKHKLLDIHLIVARSVAYALMILTLGAFYVFSFLFIGSTIFNLTFSTTEFIFYGVIMVVVAFTFQTLRRNLELLTDRVFFKGYYDTQELLKMLSSIMSTTIDLQRLTSHILDSLLHQMRVTRGTFILLDKKDHDHVYTLGSKGYDWLQKFSKEEITFFQTTKQIVMFDDVEHGTIKDILRELNVSVVIPLIVQDEKIGVLLLGEKSSGDVYSQQDVTLLEILSPQLSIAIQNAREYEEIRRFNITLREEVEKATKDLQLANDRLKDLDKLKDEFVSLASHELRTPMTAIKSYIWLLLKQSREVGTLNDKQKQYLDRTYASTERLIKLVNDMLNVSRIQSGRMTITPKPTDMTHLIQDTILEVAPAAKEHQLTVDFTPPTEEIPQVHVDPEKMKEVIINLIGNSLKFTPPEGKITISLYQKDGMVVIQVTDTGKGIKKEDLHSLFQKFGIIESNYLSKENLHGSGLGLYISKSIVEMHGGKMWVESKGENQGTTFYFSLKPVV